MSLRVLRHTSMIWLSDAMHVQRGSLIILVCAGPGGQKIVTLVTENDGNDSAQCQWLSGQLQVGRGSAGLSDKKRPCEDERAIG